MQKKLKLTVMAVFIVATALAQTEEPKQSETQDDYHHVESEHLRFIGRFSL